ncbi:Gamma-aminobutyric acid receptor subunit like protein [Argiope bruennichi]|uniref:Gamma-aminobutyric acid receptor subunit like protein n=1 Tax=Argiope bruennichi TaxID=94029 RepID=A0A8T0FDQ3_ARGBR|nr:Gamma-aminobutyric acid receptor subunit like protein [Argiope bruennichi]
MCTFREAGKLFFISLMYYIFNYGVTSTTSGFRSEGQDCIDILPINYRKLDIPKAPGGPLQIYFEFYISTIDEINESDMDFELKGFVTAKWTDNRVNCSNICPVSNYICSKYLWTPNIVFDEAKKVQPFPEREIIFIVRPPTAVSYTVRYTFKVGCKMYFGDYPFDTQRCIFSVRLRDLNILDVNIIFVRRLTGSIINIYAPSSLITAVSWVTFWLRLEAAPARVSLSITSLLTLCTQKNAQPDFKLNKTKQILKGKMWVLQTDQVESWLQSKSPPPSRGKRLSDWLCAIPSDDISRIDQIVQRHRDFAPKNRNVSTFYQKTTKYMKFQDQQGRGALQLDFEFYISNLDEIREEDMDFELKGFVSAKWTDYRLNCSDFCPIDNYICAKFLWTPNILFDDAKQVRPFPEREMLFKVRPPAAVSQTTGYMFKVGCKMDFGDYPFDTQKCIFSIRLPAPARVSLSITSLLTLCTQVQFNKSQLPPLNYITAVDIWLFVCIFLVFSTLVEFAISYNTYSKTKTSEIQDYRSEDNMKQILNSKIWILQINREETTPRDNTPRWSSMVKRFSDCFEYKDCFAMLPEDYKKYEVPLDEGFRDSSKTPGKTLAEILNGPHEEKRVARKFGDSPDF